MLLGVGGSIRGNVRVGRRGCHVRIWSRREIWLIEFFSESPYDINGSVVEGYCRRESMYPTDCRR